MRGGEQSGPGADGPASAGATPAFARTSRRRVVAGIASVPLIGVLGAAVARLGSQAAIWRPAGTGDSATRCAQCGARDHLMLSATCPAAPSVGTP